jgi:DNA-directed RNA polymerase subunit RPC12/RpoP
MLCDSCGESLIDASKRVYICSECSGDFDSGDVLYFCLKCKTEKKHEHKLEKLKGIPGEVNLKGKDKDSMTETDKKAYLDALLEDYYNLEYEDVIGGGTVKTRFKYAKV